MKIIKTEFIKGNTEFYDFDVTIAFVEKNKNEESGYYVTFLPIFKYNKHFDKLNKFKVKKRLSSNVEEDITILNKILKSKDILYNKYILKIEERLKEVHLKNYSTESINHKSNENKTIENISYSKNDKSNKDVITLRDIEKNIIACHEAGHALIGILLGELNIQKISIIPKDNSLGYTSNISEEESYLYTETELSNKIKFLLAGKVAEELIFEEHSTGCCDDLKKSSKIAFDMVCKYGMGNRTSLFINPLENETITADDIKKIDSILSKSNKEVKELLKNHKKELKTIANELYNKEELDIDYIKTLVKEETPEEADVKSSKKLSKATT